MARRHTTYTAIKKYRDNYFKLVDFAIRLDKEIYLMKQRMKKIASDEEKWLARQTYLTLELTKWEQLRADCLQESLSSKARATKLKKIEKQILEIRSQWTHNEHHLAVLEKRRFKDNVAKLVLKEARREEVQIRIDNTYKAWQQLLQVQKAEQNNTEIFKEKLLKQSETLLQPVNSSSPLGSDRQEDTPRQICYIYTTRQYHTIHSYPRLYTLPASLSVKEEQCIPYKSIKMVKSDIFQN